MFKIAAGAPVVYFDRTSYVAHEEDGSVTLVVRTNVAGGPGNSSVVFFTEDSSATGKYSRFNCLVSTLS